MRRYADRRCVYAELTEEGASRLDEALRAGVQAQTAVSQRLRTVADDLRELLAVSQQALRHP